MSTFARILTDATALIFVLLAVASVREYRRGRGSAPAWAATAFVTLGAIAALAFLPTRSEALYELFWWQVFLRLVLAVLVAFPYCLYRLASTFHAPSTRVRRSLNALTGLVIVVGFALPKFPAPSAPRPAWILPYTAAILVQWTVASVIAALWLWQGGKGRPTAARYRMRLLAAGTAAVNFAIVVSVFRPAADPDHPNTVVQLLSLGAALLLYIGLAPPRMLVERWQRPEAAAARAAMTGLVTARTPAEVADVLLPNVAGMIGAENAILYCPNGSRLASYGHCGPETAHDPGDQDLPTGVLRAELNNGGALVVHSNNYSPLFGSDRLQMLRSFADLADLALDRCAAAAREHEFISNAAHELRTPLTAMTGLATLLAFERGNLTDAQADECLDGLVRQGTRARELVNTLLDMAQMEQGDAGFGDDVVELFDVVDDSLDFTPAPFNRHVHVDIDARLRVHGDAQRLQQVVVNLLTNAYRHGGNDIEIEAHADDDRVVLTVADDGGGIPAELVPKLFDPFARGALATGTGSGLGLTICRRIIEGLGGSISYEAIPQGSRFRVELRRAA